MNTCRPRRNVAPANVALATARTHTHTQTHTHTGGNRSRGRGDNSYYQIGKSRAPFALAAATLRALECKPRRVQAQAAWVLVMNNPANIRDGWRAQGGIEALARGPCRNKIIFLNLLSSEGMCEGDGESEGPQESELESQRTSERESESLSFIKNCSPLAPCALLRTAP